MKCPKCNLLLPGDSNFCQYCGVKIEPIAYYEDQTNHISADANISCKNNPTLQETESQLNSSSTGNTANQLTQSVSLPLSSYQPEPSVSIPSSFNNSQMPTPNQTNSVVTKDSSGAKNKYCKHCGGRIDQATKKCTACGKQYFRAKVLISSVVAVLLLVLAGLNVFQYITMSRQRTEISNLEKEVAELKAVRSDINSDLRFYEKYVAIACDGKRDLYHIYGCSYLDVSSFEIYDIRDVELYGYDPCPFCH